MPVIPGWIKCYRCKSQPCHCRDGVTLYYDDSRKVLPKLKADSIDLVFTDPPYGHTENGSLQQRWEAVLGWQDGKGVYRDVKHHDTLIANDGEEANELVQWSFEEFARLLKPGSCCCGGGGPDPQFARWSLWLDEHIPFKQMIIWDKGPMGMGWHYRRSYETVLVATKKGEACLWNGGKTSENILRPGRYGIRKIIPSTEQHPTEKPIALPEHFIRLHSNEGQVVLDPFAGGGSTLLAARKLGRKCIGIESDEKYVRMIVRKLKQGIPPTKLDSLENQAQGKMLRLCKGFGSMAYREREVIKLLYGLGDGEEYSTEEVAKIFKMPVRRIRMIEQKALSKLLNAGVMDGYSST